MTALPPSPFLNPDSRFVLNEEAFLEDIQVLPAFIESPRPEYLQATEIMPIIQVLGEFAR